MTDDAVPRDLPERTGRHLCTRCLAEVRAREYFEYDHYCEACAADAANYPLASTPHGETPKKPKT